MKTAFRILLTALLVLCLVLPICADEQYSEEYFRVVDRTGALDSALTQELDQYILDHIDRLQCDYFIFADDISGQDCTMKEYSDAMYRDCDFGYGRDGTCISLMIDLPARNCELFYYGGIDSRFTTEQSDRMLDAFVDGFTSGGLSDGIRNFLTEAFLCTEEIRSLPADAAHIGQFDPEKLLVALGMGLAAGLIVAKIYTNALKKKMALHPATDANSYVVPGSFQVLNSRERYEYSVITKTPRQTSNSSGRSSGGGVSGGSRHF